MHKDVPVRTQVIAKSEGNLQTKLNIARIIARAEHLSKLVIRPAIQAVADICASKIITEQFAAVLRMIEGVEELGAKLCFEPLSNVEAFCLTPQPSPRRSITLGRQKANSFETT